MAASEFALRCLPYQQRRLRHLRRIFGANLRLIIDKRFDCSNFDASRKSFFTLHQVLTHKQTEGELLYTSEYCADLDNPNWKALVNFDRQLLGSLKQVILTYWLVRSDAEPVAVWRGVIFLDALQYLGDSLSLCESQYAPGASSFDGSAHGIHIPCFYFELFNELQLRGSSTSGAFQVRRELCCWRIGEQKRQNGQVNADKSEHEKDVSDWPTRPVDVELKRTRVSCSADELRRLVSLASRVAHFNQATSILRSKVELAVGGAIQTRAAQRDRLSEVSREEEARLTQQLADLAVARTRLAHLVSTCEACEARRVTAAREAQEARSRIATLLETRRTLRLRLEHTRAHLRERRRGLVLELANVYPIVVAPAASTIHGINLLNTAELENVKSANDTQRMSVALGFTVHLVDLLANVYDVKLRYPLRFFGSRSSVEDPITDMRMLDERNDSVPLYLSRNVNRDCYKYALYLLSEDVEVLRYRLSRPPATDSGHLLFSLYQLVQSIIRERPRFHALARLTVDSRRVAGRDAQAVASNLSEEQASSLDTDTKTIMHMHQRTSSLSSLPADGASASTSNGKASANRNSRDNDVRNELKRPPDTATLEQRVGAN